LAITRIWRFRLVWRRFFVALLDVVASLWARAFARRQRQWRSQRRRVNAVERAKPITLTRSSRQKHEGRVEQTLDLALILRGI
jgi:hypothetical protein